MAKNLLDLLEENKDEFNALGGPSPRLTLAPEGGLALAQPEAPVAAPAPTREDLYSILAKRAMAAQAPDATGLEDAQRADADANRWRSLGRVGEKVAALMQGRAPSYTGLEPTKDALNDWLLKRSLAKEQAAAEASGIERAGELEKWRRADEAAKAKAATEAAQWGKDFGIKEGAQKETGRHNREQEEIEWAKLLREKEKAGHEKGEKTAKASGDLRRELQNNQVYKDTQQLATAWQKLERASSSAAGDMSLVYGLMKMFDPGSSVREGEYANAQNASGVPDRLINLYNKTRSGNFLSPKQRSDFLEEGKRLWGAQAERYKSLADTYTTLANRAGLDPADVVLPIGMDEPTKAQTPSKRSLVINGVTFEE